MQIGINQWAFPSDMSTKEALQQAKAAGFETFEVCVGEDGPLSLEVSKRELTTLRNYAKRLDIAITSVASGLGWKYPLSSPDASVRDQGKVCIEKSLRIAQGVGADAVLVVPGMVTREVPYDVALENALNAIQDLVPLAEKLQISLAIENVWNKFLLSPVEMRDFIDACESEYVGAFFDIGNILPYGYPEQWIRILGKRIRKLHAKDFRESVGNMDGFVMLMEGDVDWPEVMVALREVGYTGPLTAEYGPYEHSSEATLAHCHASLESILTLGE